MYNVFKFEACESERERQQRARVMKECCNSNLKHRGFKEIAGEASYDTALVVVVVVVMMMMMMMMKALSNILCIEI